MSIFFCSKIYFYTLCKKKSYINQPIRRNRTNVFTTSHLVNNSNFYSNPSYRSELSSTNCFNNNEYSSTEYYSNSNLIPATNFVERTISLINQPPPSYWQIMNQNNIPVNTNNSIRPPPPSYLNVSTLNKQDNK